MSENDTKEKRIELSQHDLDHLNAGQPIYKSFDGVLLTIYSNAPITAENAADDSDFESSGCETTTK